MKGAHLLNPSCDFELLPLSLFIRSIYEAVNSQSPFSLVRLGDGEGALLGFNFDSKIQDLLYLNEHVGPQCTLNELETIRSNMKSAISTADMIGIRDDVCGVQFSHATSNSGPQFLARFKSAFKLRDVDLNLPTVDAQRIANLHKQLQVYGFSKKQSFCSQWIGIDFYTSGALSFLLSNQLEIGVVSAREGLDQIMSKALGVNVVQYKVPDKYEKQGKRKRRHFPDCYNQIIDSINVKHKGMIFIVAAGLVGKGYCDVIKNQGGIALDLGALVDYWMGKYTRPRVLQSKFHIKKSFFSKRKKVPESLLMTNSNTEQLVEKWLNSNSNIDLTLETGKKKSTGSIL